jgi:hypothetical protein
MVKRDGREERALCYPPDNNKKMTGVWSYGPLQRAGQGQRGLEVARHQRREGMLKQRAITDARLLDSATRKPQPCVATTRRRTRRTRTRDTHARQGATTQTQARLASLRHSQAGVSTVDVRHPAPATL